MKIDSLSFNGYAKLNGTEHQVVKLLSNIKTSNWFLRVYKPKLDLQSEKLDYIIFSNNDLKKNNLLLKMFKIDPNSFDIFAQLSKSIRMKIYDTFPRLKKSKIFKLDIKTDFDNLVNIINN